MEYQGRGKHSLNELESIIEKQKKSEFHYHSLRDCCHQLLDAVDVNIPPTRSVIGLRILLNRPKKL